MVNINLESLEQGVVTCHHDLSSDIGDSGLNMRNIIMMSGQVSNIPYGGDGEHTDFLND